jgi:hypothetical protein
MDEGQQSRWQPSRRELLWAGGIATLAFVLIAICGYLFGWKWTGLPKKTLWDWLSLLIVPTVLAIGGYLFTSSENRATRQAAAERAQDDALQAYLDGMSQLLTDKELPLHRAQPGDSLRMVARARTLTVLGRLDSERKRSVLQFLFESELIYKELTLLHEGGLIKRRHNIVSLREANLIGANLIGANLIGANLGSANLGSADLSGANLSRAWLGLATLNMATLSRANLSDANLGSATLNMATLNMANLSGAFLSGAFLSGAFLSDAREWTVEQLTAARSLEGTIMPDGQTLRDDRIPIRPTFEAWLKSKDRGEDGKNE